MLKKRKVQLVIDEAGRTARQEALYADRSKADVARLNRRYGVLAGLFLGAAGVAVFAFADRAREQDIARGETVRSAACAAALGATAVEGKAGYPLSLKALPITSICTLDATHAFAVAVMPEYPERNAARQPARLDIGVCLKVSSDTPIRVTEVRELK